MYVTLSVQGLNVCNSPFQLWIPLLTFKEINPGSSLDLYHHCRDSVGWAIRDPLCYRLKVLLGRCFAFAFSDSSHSSCGHLHSRIPVFRSNSEDKCQARSPSTPHGSLLPHLSATQSGGNAAGIHGAVDGQSYIPDLLPTPVRGVTDFCQGVVGGCWSHLCFLLGMYWQHIYHLRIGRRSL